MLVINIYTSIQRWYMTKQLRPYKEQQQHVMVDEECRLAGWKIRQLCLQYELPHQ